MIIAEIGLNHLGKKKYLNRYLNTLLKTNIDAITLQIREPNYYKKYPYLKLDKKIYSYVSNYVHSYGKKFGMAVCDWSVINFLTSIGVDFYKVIRNDINNNLLIDTLMNTKKPVFVSTGMSSQEDIENFISYIKKNNNFKLNHTQLSYNVGDCNLSAISAMKKYGLDVSFGNHCENHNVIYLSLAYNPSDILFYVRLNTKDDFPDSKHAIFIDDVNKITNNLKMLPLSIGNGTKTQINNRIENEKSNSFGRK